MENLKKETNSTDDNDDLIEEDNDDYEEDDYKDFEDNNEDD